MYLISIVFKESDLSNKGYYNRDERMSLLLSINHSQEIILTKKQNKKNKTKTKKQNKKKTKTKTKTKNKNKTKQNKNKQKKNLDVFFLVTSGFSMCIIITVFKELFY